jgi:hypothetical protein
MFVGKAKSLPYYGTPERAPLGRLALLSNKRPKMGRDKHSLITKHF